MIEQLLIELIKMNVENICLESSEDKTRWFFSCYIGHAYDQGSQEVWIEADNPYTVLEKAIMFISRYNRGLKVGDRKRSKWDNRQLI